MNNFEIFGTLGPADCAVDILKNMFLEGMTGIRLNLSHKNLADCEEWLSNYQTAAKEAGVTPDLLIDMQGPELRIGVMDGTLELHNDDMIPLVHLSDTKKGIPCPDIIFPFLIPGQMILLNDGTIEAVVCENSDQITCRITRGGLLSSRKSIALPGAKVYPPTLTENDLFNLDHAAEYHVTGIMQPFVRNAEDLKILRKELLERGLNDVRIFAKIENLDGVRSLSELLPYCDHIIIARGDLGNATTLPKLIGVQKQIASICRDAQKPFMVVTQMLASMEQNPVPTRAEVSDIYNAVLDGAASIMVTGETAVGRYPVEVIRCMKETSEDALKFLNK